MLSNLTCNNFTTLNVNSPIINNKLAFIITNICLSLLLSLSFLLLLSLTLLLVTVIVIYGYIFVVVDIVIIVVVLYSIFKEAYTEQICPQIVSKLSIFDFLFFIFSSGVVS